MLGSRASRPSRAAAAAATTTSKSTPLVTSPTQASFSLSDDESDRATPDVTQTRAQRARTASTDFKTLISSCISQTLHRMHYQKVAIGLKFHQLYENYASDYELTDRQDLIRCAMAVIMGVSENILLIPVCFDEMQHIFASVCHDQKMKGEEEMVKLITEREVRDEMEILLETQSVSVRLPSDPTVNWPDAFTSYLNRAGKYLAAQTVATQGDLKDAMAKLSLDTRKVNALMGLCRTQLAAWLAISLSPPFTLTSSTMAKLSLTENADDEDGAVACGGNGARPAVNGEYALRSPPDTAPGSPSACSSSSGGDTPPSKQKHNGGSPTPAGRHAGYYGASRHLMATTPAAAAAASSNTSDLKLASPLDVLLETADMGEAYTIVRRFVAHMLTHIIANVESSTEHDAHHHGYQSPYAVDHHHHHHQHHHQHHHPRRERGNTVPVERGDQKKRRLARRAVAVQLTSRVCWLDEDDVRQFEEDLEHDLASPLTNIGQYMLTRTAAVPTAATAGSGLAGAGGASSSLGAAALSTLGANAAMLPLSSTSLSSSTAASSCEFALRPEVACTCGGSSCRGRCDIARLWTALARLSVQSSQVDEAYLDFVASSPSAGQLAGSATTTPNSRTR
ncbi:hypothetical protein RI367_008338 [Sorochytrium milnesiophthora]